MFLSRIFNVDFPYMKGDCVRVTPRNFKLIMFLKSAKFFEISLYIDVPHISAQGGDEVGNRWMCVANGYIAKWFWKIK